MSTNTSGAMTLAEIKAAIPHREPMLLLDEVLERTEERIVCRRQFRPDEFFVRGHYPEYPLVPGVILCEAAMQAGAVLLSGLSHQEGIPVAARLDEVRFRRMVRPGDTITIHVEISERSSNVFFMKARVLLEGAVAMRCTFVCTVTRPESASAP